MKINTPWKEMRIYVMLSIGGLLCVGCKESKEEVVSEDQKIGSGDVEKRVNELEVVAVESEMWRLSFKSFLGERYQFSFEYKPSDGPVAQNRIPASQAISKGDTFFTGDPGNARFKLRDIEVRDEDGPNGRPSSHWAIIEDLREPKKGKTYQLKLNQSAGEKAKSVEYDHTVYFRLNTTEEEGNEIEVEEGESFSLPRGEKVKPYKLIEVKFENPNETTRKAVAVVVQYEGVEETKTREIPVP